MHIQQLDFLNAVLSCVTAIMNYQYTEEEERAYYLKTMAERKQKFKMNKKKMNQRGKDKVSYVIILVKKRCLISISWYFQFGIALDCFKTYNNYYKNIAVLHYNFFHFRN